MHKNCYTPWLNSVHAFGIGAIKSDFALKAGNPFNSPILTTNKCTVKTTPYRNLPKPGRYVCKLEQI